MKLSWEQGGRLLPWIGIVALYAVLRLIDLDRGFHFDERLWLARSINFFSALTNGDFAHTYQREHPGVLTTWAGTIAYMLRYPELPSMMQAYFPHDDAANRLWALGYDPREVLTTARVAKVLMQTAIFAVFLRYLVSLVGQVAAILCGLLISFSPALIHWDSWLHVDGLATMGAAATVVATAYAAERTDLFKGLAGSTALHWGLAGAISSLAWMSRITLIALIGVMGLALLIQLFIQLKESNSHSKFAVLARAFSYGIVWVIGGVAGALLLLPALWVTPGKVISEVILLPISGVRGEDDEFFTENHFVDSWWYFPIELVLRTTIFDWIGVLVVLIAGYTAAKAGLLPRKALRLVIIAIVFSIVFIIGNSISPKKFDRYIMAVYPLVAMVAAIGFSIGWNWMSRVAGATGRVIAIISAAIILMLPLLTTIMGLPERPNYHNPITLGLTDREVHYPIDTIQHHVTDTFRDASEDQPIVVDPGSLGYALPIYLAPDEPITIQETPIDSPAAWYETDFKIVEYETPDRELFDDTEPFERYEFDDYLVAELYAPGSSPLPQALMQPTHCYRAFGDSLVMLQAVSRDGNIHLYFIADGQGTFEVELTTEIPPGVFATERTVIETDTEPHVVQEATFNNPREIGADGEESVIFQVEVFTEDGERMTVTMPWSDTTEEAAIVDSQCYSQPAPGTSHANDD